MDLLLLELELNSISSLLILVIREDLDILVIRENPDLLVIDIAG
jgi:hypothetical protein